MAQKVHLSSQSSVRGYVRLSQGAPVADLEPPPETRHWLAGANGYARPRSEWIIVRQLRQGAPTVREDLATLACPVARR